LCFGISQFISIFFINQKSFFKFICFKISNLFKIFCFVIFIFFGSFFIKILLFFISSKVIGIIEKSIFSLKVIIFSKFLKSKFLHFGELFVFLLQAKIKFFEKFFSQKSIFFEL
jgi:hypothetical protein